MKSSTILRRHMVSMLVLFRENVIYHYEGRALQANEDIAGITLVISNVEKTAC